MTTDAAFLRNLADMQSGRVSARLREIADGLDALAVAAGVFRGYAHHPALDAGADAERLAPLRRDYYRKSRGHR